jgi:hypothetical protein
MCRDRHFRYVSIVAAILISASCLGQQVWEADRSPAPPTPHVVRGPFSSSLAAKTPPSATAVPATPSREIDEASEPLPRSSAPPRPADDSGEPTAIAVAPSMRSAFAPNRQPGERLPLLRSLFGRRTEVGIFTVGNFNSTSFVHLNDSSHGGQQVVSSNKSSFGGGAEYRWRWSDRNALGFLYVQNPSDGKLWVSSSPSSSGPSTAATQSYIWPQMRWDLSILATQSFKAKNLTPFVCEGPGIVVTNGYSVSGWSAGFAFVAGLGADYQLNRRLSARTGITFLNTKGGCYGDPTCGQTWGVVEDMRVGFVYRWGAENGSYAVK